MRVEYVSFETAGVFSSRDTAYQKGDKTLDEFIALPPESNSFPIAARKKSTQAINRGLLVRVLKEQHSNVTDLQSKNIDSLLDDKTFTIVTGHQPSLFTGPLYFVYKIYSIVKLAERMTHEHGDYRFVPVYWLGAEDHDFEEISRVKIFNEKWQWENEIGGSVGKLPLDGILPLLGQLTESDKNGNDLIRKVVKIYKEAHREGKTYGEAFSEMVNELFGDLGLLILDASHPDFKASAMEIFEKEIFDNTSFKPVGETQEKLMAKGFPSQAFVREINLFYTGEGFRERLVSKGDGFEVLNQDIFFSKEEMKEELGKHTERFSPNVVMRPLYQEFILPNVAYVGGGGELAYWMERKKQFEIFGVPFPILVRRDSFIVITKKNWDNWTKSDLGIQDLWRKKNEILKGIVKENSDSELDLNREKAELKSLYGKIQERLKEVDATLEKPALGEEAKALKGLENLESKMIRAEKRKNEVLVSRITSAYDSVFPGGKLQERVDNLFSMILMGKGELYLRALEFADPLDKRLKILIED